MAEIRFYHLQRQTLEEALPKLMERVQEAGLRAVIKVPGRTHLDTLDKVLWDYDPGSFLAHDKEGCKHADQQPFYLTTGDEVPNGASVLVLVDAVDPPAELGFDRCLYMFDGRDMAIVEKARAQWKTFKDMGAEMSYWQQGERGGWEKKA
ncbi:DNA polymerase III subunit chi [Pseudokordiimonas caeni]|uniref:DNA polymerase III subunit chi n=1 Tax=Pseudokordiimonas caeni TaxID=2997908 RepID=UPI0028111E13|nr:DNA polymerase III subunit chi [Pseudokordiimonas caeni]